MTTREILDLIFRDPQTKYELAEFDYLGIPIHEIIEIYPKTITSGRDTGKTKYFMKTFAKFESGRKEVQVYSERKANPEEIVRQLWVYKLINNYNYNKDEIILEKKVFFGEQVYDKPSDIVVYRDNACQTPKIIFEVKKPKRKDGIAQLKSYMNADGSPVGVWSNGSDKIILYRPYPRDFDDTLSDLPKRNEEPTDVMEVSRRLSDLKTHFNFKKIIQDLEELVLADSGADEFNEIFKLIFAKIWDEKEAEENRTDKIVKFRKTIDPETTFDRINKLYHKASEEWPGVFVEGEDILLRKDHLQVCIGPIESVRLMGSNLRIMDDAFEYLLPTEAKKKKGQFFTPRHVVEMCVRMLNPKRNEYIIDPACGSGGFLIHAMDWCYQASDATEREVRKSRYASKYLWGIDFEMRAAKTSRALMLIAGDGHTNIFGPDVSSLDPRTFYETASGQQLMVRLRENNLLEARIPGNEALDDEDKAWEYFENMKFNLALANPPFAGEMKDKNMLVHYDLAKPALKRARNKTAKVERDILFIERILNLIKPGGRVAIVLPQGKFNNPSLAFIREWILEKARLLSVVGLHGNTFKPHTGTKTSVIFVQKYTTEQIIEIQRVKERVSVSCPDYKEQIKLLIKEYENELDIPEESMPDEIVELIVEQFEEPEPESVEDDNNPEENTESDPVLELEGLIEEADNKLKRLRDDLGSTKDELDKLKEEKDVIKLKKGQEIETATQMYDDRILEKQEEIGKKIGPKITAIRQDKAMAIKTIREAYKKRTKDLFQVHKETRRRIKARIKALEMAIPYADRELKLLTNKGKLTLIIEDDDLITKLKNRFIHTEVAKELDYPIFMGVSERGGKNNSGDYEFLLDDDGNLLANEYGQLLVDQDLVNYNLSRDDLENIDDVPEEQLCIAEAFIRFAKRNSFSFWSD